MAERPVTDGVGKWRNDTPFPKDSYVIHCIEEEFGLSKSTKNPMLTRTWEIVSPETITVGDRILSIAGQTVTQYLTTKVHNEDDPTSWDTKRSDNAFSNLRDDLKMLGYDGSSIDDENPPKIAKGKTVDAIVYAKEGTQCKAPTPEQVAKGLKQGDPIKVNGKEVKNYQLNILQIVGMNTSVKIGSTAF